MLDKNLYISPLSFQNEEWLGEEISEEEIPLKPEKDLSDEDLEEEDQDTEIE